MTEVARYFAISATFVALHILGLALYTGAVRVRNKKWVIAEDAKFNKGEKVDIDVPDVIRVIRAHQNLMENAVPFFVIGALYTATNPSKTGALAYFGTFIGARVLHTLAYLNAKQPWRTLFFGVGVLACIGMAVHVLRVSF